MAFQTEYNACVGTGRADHQRPCRTATGHGYITGFGSDLEDFTICLKLSSWLSPLPGAQLHLLHSSQHLPLLLWVLHLPTPSLVRLGATVAAWLHVLLLFAHKINEFLNCCNLHFLSQQADNAVEIMIEQCGCSTRQSRRRNRYCRTKKLCHKHCQKIYLLLRNLQYAAYESIEFSCP